MKDWQRWNVEQAKWMWMQHFVHPGCFSARGNGKLRRLTPLKIGSKGQMLEWDKEYPEKEPGHRHMSCMYGLYPSEMFANAPDYQQACRTFLDLRISNGGGYTEWSCAWLISLFTVLEDRENAYKYPFLQQYFTTGLTVGSVKE